MAFIFSAENTVGEQRAHNDHEIIILSVTHTKQPHF